MAQSPLPPTTRLFVSVSPVLSWDSKASLLVRLVLQLDVKSHGVCLTKVCLSGGHCDPSVQEGLDYFIHNLGVCQEDQVGVQIELLNDKLVLPLLLLLAYHFRSLVPWLVTYTFSSLPCIAATLLYQSSFCVT